MSAATRILIGAHRWQVWHGTHLLHDAAAAADGVAALITTLPAGPVTLWLDRPDEHVAPCMMVARRLRDQRRLLANQIQPPGALEAGWGRWLSAGRAHVAPAWLLQLQSPTLLNQLVAALMLARHAVVACHSHTLALLPAPRGRHLYIAAGLVDGVRHIWVDGGVLRFTRLCPGAPDSAQASADVEATLQHLHAQQWWDGQTPLRCDSVVALQPAVLARYPQLQMQATAPAAQASLGASHSEYPRPPHVVRHYWRTCALRRVRRGTPLLGALALAYTAVAFSVALQSPAAVPLLAMAAPDIARRILRQLPPPAPSLPEQLRQLSLVLQQHPGPTLQALQWRDNGSAPPTLTLDFAPTEGPVMQPEATWFADAHFSLQPGATPQRWQLLAQTGGAP